MTINKRAGWEGGVVFGNEPRMAVFTSLLCTNLR